MHRLSACRYTRWRDELAARGAVVVGVEFRNSSGVLGPHPYPAGLNDCFSGLKWTHEQRAALGVSKIVVSGESGGGHLSLATCLKARDEGATAMIDGVYAMCPYFLGGFDGRQLAAATTCASLHECDGYFLHSDFDVLAELYYGPGFDPDQVASMPLANPWFAKDLSGLPPHVISVCS